MTSPKSSIFGRIDYFSKKQAVAMPTLRASIIFAMALVA